MFETLVTFAYTKHCIYDRAYGLCLMTFKISGNVVYRTLQNSFVVDSKINKNDVYFWNAAT